MDYLKRTWAEIDLDALLHNFGAIRRYTDGRIAAVVKADAYGHGAAVVAPVLQSAGADMFAVSNIEEAVELRKNGITVPILVLGFTPASYTKTLCEHKIIQTVYSYDYALELSNNALACKEVLQCHLKLDTGMSRLGFDCRDGSLCGVEDMIKVCSLAGLEISGAFTHFATADRDGDGDGIYMQAQYKRFLAACERLKANGVRLSCVHCCNSAGFMLHRDKHQSLSRPGIILYGLTPSSTLKPEIDLMPAMSFKSTVSFVKTIRAGDAVSYGRRFTAEREMTVATVAAGYADGYPRALSGKGYVIIKGQKAPILGNVCMDQTVVDVSGIENVTQGDEVTLFGSGLPAEEVAGLCGTINYELVCGVSRRVPRVYLKGGKEVKVLDYIIDK